MLTSAQIMEIGFNILYLIGIYAIVIIMSSRLSRVPASDTTARLFRNGFLLLAIGDTGHVGFRVIAYFMGSLESSISIAGLALPLVGLGALATAITVTFLYMFLLEAGYRRFSLPRDILYWILIAAGIIRLVIFLFPQNEWGNVVPPFGWSLARNLPLIVQGTGVAILYLKFASINSDKAFRSMGWMIICSFAFYLPVILFVQRIPLLGMLMIPKTLAYIGAALIALFAFYPAKKPR